MTERLEVQRAIAAEPADIFKVLTDPAGHVAIDSSGMLMGASGERVAAVGDTFTVHMDREALNDYPLGLYDVLVTIVKFVPDREIAWTPRGQLNLGHVYGYELAPIPEGTLVTSYYDWSSVDQEWKDANIFPVIPEGFATRHTRHFGEDGRAGKTSALHPGVAGLALAHGPRVANIGRSRPHGARHRVDCAERSRNSRAHCWYFCANSSLEVGRG